MGFCDCHAPPDEYLAQGLVQPLVDLCRVNIVQVRLPAASSRALRSTVKEREVKGRERKEGGEPSRGSR